MTNLFGSTRIKGKSIWFCINDTNSPASPSLWHSAAPFNAADWQPGKRAKAGPGELRLGGRRASRMLPGAEAVKLNQTHHGNTTQSGLQPSGSLVPTLAFWLFLEHTRHLRVLHLLFPFNWSTLPPDKCMVTPHTPRCLPWHHLVREAVLDSSM